MLRRMIVALGVMLLAFTFLLSRLAVLTSASELALAARRQGAFVLEVAETRGTIYDANFQRLTGADERLKAAVLPCEQSADLLLRLAGEEERPALLKRLQALTPFLYEIAEEPPYTRGVEVFPVAERYGSPQPAVHLVGQLDPATGKGASGLERAYEQLLSSTGGSLKVRYTTDALRRAIDDAGAQVVDTGYNTGAGLVLTLDRDIQRVAEEAASSIERGAVVVMDPYTGDVKASVSLPLYDPNNMAAALGDPGSPFINRAFYSYPVGSTFKLLTAATALEQGYDIDRAYNCEGAIEVLDQTFHCLKLTGHGWMDMTRALEQSCNPYFISLALEIGGPTLLYKAGLLGWGADAELAPGMRTQAGTLPTARELAAPAAVANFGLGQGVLTATPIQIAALVSSIANGGGAVTPRLVAGTTSDGTSYSSRTAVYTPRPVFRPEAAEAVRGLMVSVVEQGSGRRAKPEEGGAGGKTASAQTGRYVGGEEVVHAWFSGFYPAENPRYTIVVLVEGGDSGSNTACPVFKIIADGIAGLE